MADNGIENTTSVDELNHEASADDGFPPQNDADESRSDVSCSFSSTLSLLSQQNWDEESQNGDVEDNLDYDTTDTEESINCSDAETTSTEATEATDTEGSINCPDAESTSTGVTEATGTEGSINCPDAETTKTDVTEDEDHYERDFDYLIRMVDLTEPSSLEAASDDLMTNDPDESNYFSDPATDSSRTVSALESSSFYMEVALESSGAPPELVDSFENQESVYDHPDSLFSSSTPSRASTDAGFHSSRSSNFDDNGVEPGTSYDGETLFFYGSGRQGRDATFSASTPMRYYSLFPMPISPITNNSETGIQTAFNRAVGSERTNRVPNPWIPILGDVVDDEDDDEDDDKDGDKEDDEELKDLQATLEGMVPASYGLDWQNEEETEVVTYITLADLQAALATVTFTTSTPSTEESVWKTENSTNGFWWLFRK